MRPPSDTFGYFREIAAWTAWPGGLTAAMCSVASSPWTVAGFGNRCGKSSYGVWEDELRGPNIQRGLAQDLLLQLFTQRERPEFIEILLDVRYARTRPIRAEEGFMSDLLKAREILEQGLGRNAADVEINVGMTTNEKECSLHPQRAATVRQQDFQFREIDGDIIQINGIAIFVARPGKNRRTGMKHDRQVVGLCSAVNNLQFLDTVQIVIRKQKLVRRVNFDHANSESNNLFHIGQDVRGMSRMQASAGKQRLRIFLNVVRNT